MSTKKTLSLVFLFMLAAAVLTGVAYGQDSGMTYTGCLNAGGNINKVAIGNSPAKPCSGNQKMITWNAVGPQGPEGPTGPEGPPGVIGLANKNCGPGEGVVIGFDADGMSGKRIVRDLTKSWRGVKMKK